MIFLILYLEFFKIGLFSLGGGLATLPFLQNLSERYGWITHEQLLNIIAIAESTPGPIGVNSATFVGYSTAGVLGGIAATLGLATPSVVIIVLIAKYFAEINQHHLVKQAFHGVRPAVAGLIAFVAFELGRHIFLEVQPAGSLPELLALFNWQAIAWFAILLVLMQKLRHHPIVYIVAGALAGILFRF